MIINSSIFREYDIRGVVGRDLDAEFARALGRVFASLVKELVPDKQSLVVGVGRDCRLSGEELNAGLVLGLREGGVDVLNSGMGPTPQLYYSVVSNRLDGGIQITGSHNPADQNGFKMMIAQKTLSGDLIQKLRYGVEEICKTGLSQVSSLGSYSEIDTNSAYINELIARSKPMMGSRKLKVVVDAGNGVGGMVGPQVLRALGCEIIELYTTPDGRFPNHHPDPTELKNIKELQEVVIKEKACVGMAWDGDADRLGVIDENGNVIYGDMLLYIFGRQLLKELKNPKIIADVKCSQILFDGLVSEGAEVLMSKTGHSLIKAKIKETKAALAGEMSGHMFFVHRYYGFDDALHAAARLVEIMSNSDVPLSMMLADLPKVVCTPEIRVDCEDELKFMVIERAKKYFAKYDVNTTDGLRVKFDNGWGLVRASNTQPVLVMRFEAESESKLEEYQQLVKTNVNKVYNELRGGI